MRAFFTSVFSAGCLLVGSAAAHAAIIAPGSVLIPAPAEPSPVGGITIASTVVPFVVPGQFSGSVLSEVISGDLSNPFGGLTFVYRVTNDGVAGPNSIGRVTVESYAGFLTDVSYATPGVGVAPGSIDRSVTSEVLGFNFLPTPVDPLTGFLGPGLSSRLLVIQTNAPAHTLGTMFIIDGAITSVSVFAPAIPAPGTLLALMAAPLLGRRRRRS